MFQSLFYWMFLSDIIIYVYEYKSIIESFKYCEKIFFTLLKRKEIMRFNSF